MAGGSPLKLKEAGVEDDLWRRNTFKEPGQIFGDALEIPRGGKAEECTSKHTQDSHLPGGEGPSVSAQGFTHPKIFTYGHQAKGKGKTQLHFKVTCVRLLLANVPQLVSPSQRWTFLCVIGNKENRSGRFDKSFSVSLCKACSNRIM